MRSPLQADFHFRTHKMILSPKEDFKNRTLKALSSPLEKLSYVCSLRNPDGTYDHWGLKQLLGEAKANDTIRGIHADLATEATRTPIRELSRQYENSDSPRREPLVLNAPSNGDELLSDHLRLIQDSVTAVAESANSSHPAS
jgi:hypothetical protein